MRILKKFLMAIIAITTIISYFIYKTCFFIYDNYGVLMQATLKEEFLGFFEGSRKVFALHVCANVLIVAILYFEFIWLAKNTFAKKLVGKIIYIILIVGLLVGSIFLGKTGYDTVEAQDYIDYVVRHVDPWFQDNTSVTHALGAIDGNTYTNSKEALENSYANGLRVLECDFSLTSDGEMVCIHDFSNNVNLEVIPESYGMSDENPPTKEEFLQVKIYGEYTAICLEDILLFMAEHEDMVLVTDTKDDDYDLYMKEFQTIYDTAQDLDCLNVLDQMVVQIYSQEMLDDIKTIYDFENYIFTLYKLKYRGNTKKFKKYVKFCRANGVDVITVSKNYYDDELVEIAGKYGIKLYVHTVNGDEVQEYNSKGVGVYTDGL